MILYQDSKNIKIFSLGSGEGRKGKNALINVTLKDSFYKTKFPETQPMGNSHRRSDIEEKYYKYLREYYLYGKIRCWHVS